VPDDADLARRRALEWHDDIKVDTGDPLDAYVWGIGPKGETGHALPLTRVLLDESFWRALGKAQGWRRSEWREQWHRLIDELADGRSVEQFFRKLGAVKNGRA
jgi:hypothetical protein